jgi:hypothetical protein
MAEIAGVMNMKLGKFYFHAKLTIALVILIVIVMLGSGCTMSSTVKEPTETQNSGLVIRYLTAPKQLEPSRGAEILCIATDEVDDILNYEWSATGGQIQTRQEPDSIIWIAPDKTDNYTITVVVTNAKGIKATKSVNILVTNEPPRYPVITSVTCQDCKNGIEASRSKEYIIKCDASDPTGDKLHYTWFATIGKIKGEGPNATWFTGSLYGNALITVIVADDKGNKTEGYLAINVSCCH